MNILSYLFNPLKVIGLFTFNFGGGGGSASTLGGAGGLYGGGAGGGTGTGAQGIIVFTYYPTSGHMLNMFM